MNKYDVVVVGAGFAGAVTARKLAETGKRVLILEKRDHIAGNAYDFVNDNSVLVHLYGPHIFHTDNEEVYNFLSRFTDWREYKHQVAAEINDRTMPVPFNFEALEKVFGERAESLKKKLLAAFADRKKVAINELLEVDDPEIHKIADYVYEHYYAYYSEKQWGKHFSELDDSIFKRVPIYLSDNSYYFEDKWQGLPAAGYTEMFKNILDHDLIELKLNTDALDNISLAAGRVYLEAKVFSGPVIYTGSIDQLFNYEYGHLEYRTLDFKFENYNQQYFQDYGVVNYTVDQHYTRITEYKHLTGQKLKDKTTIVKEYPRELEKESDIPYYPIPARESRKSYYRYQKLLADYDNFFCLGRLAEYKYYNMDQVAAKALKLSNELKG